MPCPVGSGIDEPLLAVHYHNRILRKKLKSVASQFTPHRSDKAAIAYMDARTASVALIGLFVSKRVSFPS